MSAIEMIFKEIVVPIVGVTVAGIGGWFLKQNKTKRDAKKLEVCERLSELEIVQKTNKIWCDLAEKLEKKLDDRENEIKELKGQLNTISTQYEALLKKLTQIEKDYSLLEKNYKELKKEISK